MHAQNQLQKHILEEIRLSWLRLRRGSILKRVEYHGGHKDPLVQALEYCGYIARNAQKNYTLNIKALQLDYSVLAYTDIVYVQNIQALIGFTSNINIGTRWPAHATVIGQILLSSLSDNEIIHLYKNFNNWKIYSESTPKNSDELLIKIHAARKSVYLTSWRQFNKDRVASAAPVRHPIQRTIPYVFSVSHPPYSLNRTKYEAEVIPHLIEAAKKMSSYIA